MVNKLESISFLLLSVFVHFPLPLSFDSLDEDSDIRLLRDELCKSYFIGLGRGVPEFPMTRETPPDAYKRIYLLPGSSETRSFGWSVDLLNEAGSGLPASWHHLVVLLIFFEAKAQRIIYFSPTSSYGEIHSCFFSATNVAKYCAKINLAHVR